MIQNHDDDDGADILPIFVCARLLFLDARDDDDVTKKSTRKKSIKNRESYKTESCFFLFFTSRETIRGKTSGFRGSRRRVNEFKELRFLVELYVTINIYVGIFLISLWPIIGHRFPSGRVRRLG